VPRRAARANPSPISTPLTAGMLPRAIINRALSRRSQCTWEPSPGGTPRATPSMTPPRVSRSCMAVSTAPACGPKPPDRGSASGPPPPARTGFIGKILREGRPDRPDLDHVAADRDPEGLQELLAQGPHRHPGGRLPGRGPLEARTEIPVAILDRRRQVHMARPGDRHRRHRPPPPFGVIPVLDLKGDGRPRGPPFQDPAQEDRSIFLDLHSGPRPQAALPSGQLPVHRLHIHRKAGREALQDGHQGRPMGFPGREKPQGHARSPPRPRIKTDTIRGTPAGVPRTRCRIPLPPPTGPFTL
jgi:hypothetical protein